MPVYFIRVGDDGPVKIGWAKNAALRLKQLQVNHHEPLRMVRLIETTRLTERWLHERFAALRLVGEWFRFDAEMLVVEPPDLGPVPPDWRAKKAARNAGRPTPVSWAAYRCSVTRPCTECLGLLPDTTDHLAFTEPFLGGFRCEAAE